MGFQFVDDGFYSDGLKSSPFQRLSFLEDHNLSSDPLNRRQENPPGKNAVLTDISTFINTEHFLSGKQKLDGLGLYDLDCMVLSVVLKDKVYIIQPFDERYPDTRFLDWAEHSSVLSRLRDEKILQVAKVGLWEKGAWQLTGLDLDRWSEKELEKFYGEPERLSLGLGQKVSDYETNYRGMYSPELIGATPKMDALHMLLYRTNLCIRYAMACGMPYLPHSLKLPIVKRSFEGLVPQPTGARFIQQMLSVEARRTHAIEEKIGFAYATIKTPPLLSTILDDVKKPMDIVDKAIELRNLPLTRKFAKWSSEVDEALYRRDSDALGKAVTEVNRIEAELAADLLPGAEATVGFAVQAIFDPTSIPRKTLGKLLTTAIAKVWRYVRKPHLIFLKDAAVKASDWELRRDAINRIFGSGLKPNDFDVYARIIGGS